LTTAFFSFLTFYFTDNVRTYVFLFFEILNLLCKKCVCCRGVNHGMIPRLKTNLTMNYIRNERSREKRAKQSHLKRPLTIKDNSLHNSFRKHCHVPLKSFHACDYARNERAPTTHPTPASCFRRDPSRSGTLTWGLQRSVS